MTNPVCPLCGKEKTTGRGVYHKTCGKIARKPRGRELAKIKYQTDTAGEKARLREWRKNNKEHYLASARKSYEKHKAKVSARLKEHRRRKPWQIVAHKSLNKAVAAGVVVRKPCEICGNARSYGHHNSYLPEDYLKVTWFCQSHHRAWHKLFLPEIPA